MGIGSTAVTALIALGIGVSGSADALVAATTAAPAVVAPSPVGAVDSYADLVSRVAPAVVTVRSTRLAHRTQAQPEAEDFMRRFFGREDMVPRAVPRRQAGLGSGVVVRADGYVLTNNHVIDGADRVRVELTDGRSFEATVVGADPPSDLAVLKVPARELATLPLGDSDRARVGDVVLALGNPLGVGQTVTMGIVSGKGRATGAGDDAFEDFIQTDAPINQGNSGGALVNLRGELVGINSQILSPVGFNIGIGFAIPSNMARHVMDQLIERGGVRRGLLGVTAQGLTADLARGVGLAQARGAIVTDVAKDGAVAQAGLTQGDVILAVNGAAVDSSNNLRNLVARLDPGSEVTLRVWRDGQEREAKARLGERKSERAAAEMPAEAEDRGKFGLAIEALTADAARQLGVEPGTGVAVTDVDPDGPAAEGGVQSGDVIQQVNGRAVKSVDELKSALDAASADKPVLVLVNRRGAHLFLTMNREG